MISAPASRSTPTATPTSPARRSRRTSRRPPARSIEPARSATRSRRSSPRSTRPARRSSTPPSSAAATSSGAAAIAIDAAGNAYVTGQTKSSNFPTTGGAFDRTFNVDTCPRCGIDQYDAFVLKLNAAGSALVYSTFLGGFNIDDGMAIAVDAVGQRLRRRARPKRRNFPTTAGAFDRTYQRRLRHVRHQAECDRVCARLLHLPGRNGGGVPVAGGG